MVALVMAPTLLFMGAAVAGENLTLGGVSILIIVLLASLIAVHLVMLLNPGSHVTRFHIVLRHLRIAPFRRAASGDPALLLRLGRRRFSELHDRLKNPFSAFDHDRHARSLAILSLLVMLLAWSASNIVRDVADRRSQETIEALDRSSPTYDADFTAAIVDELRSTSAARRLSLGGILASAVLVSAGIARTEFLRRRALRRLESRSCPDCGYRLQGAPAAVAPKLLKGVPSGPVACPECGSPWPLIPPPTRDEIIAAAAWRASRPRRTARAAHAPD